MEKQGTSVEMLHLRLRYANICKDRGIFGLQKHSCEQVCIRLSGSDGLKQFQRSLSSFWTVHIMRRESMRFAKL